MRISNIITILNDYGSLGEFNKHYYLLSVSRRSERVCIVVLCCRKDLEVGKKKVERWRRELRDKDLHRFINVIPIVGNEKMRQVFNPVDGTLEIKCNDFYEGLPEKMLGAFLYVLNVTRAQLVLKIDVNLDVHDWTLFWETLQLCEQTDAEVFGFIRKAEDGFNRFWHFGKCNSDAWNSKKYSRPAPPYWPDGGRGYVIKRSGLEKIFQHVINPINKFELGDHIYEDVMIGEIISATEMVASHRDFSKTFLIDDNASPNFLS